MRSLIKSPLLIPGLAAFTISLTSLYPGLGLIRASEGLRIPMIFAQPTLGDRGNPGGRPRGGSSRGACILANEQLPMTALVPVMPKIEVEQGNIGFESESLDYQPVTNLTTQDRSDFWFYIPYILDGTTDLEFVLQDIDDNTLYEGRVTPTTDRAGIAKIILPETVPPLVRGEVYKWFFIVDCDSNLPDSVSGQIERATLTAELRSQIDQATPRDQAALYASNGIWQDSLNILASLYSDDLSNTNLREDWMTLLTSGGLDTFYTEPFLGEFSLEKD